MEARDPFCFSKNTKIKFEMILFAAIELFLSWQVWYTYLDQ